MSARYLTFRLEALAMAVDLSLVREVVILGPVTPVPGSPGGLVGAVAVRGTVLPLLDPRPAWGLPVSAPAREGDTALRLLVPPHELLLLAGQAGEVTEDPGPGVLRMDLPALVVRVAAGVAEAARRYPVNLPGMATWPKAAASDEARGADHEGS